MQRWHGDGTARTPTTFKIGQGSNALYLVHRQSRWSLFFPLKRWTNESAPRTTWCRFNIQEIETPRLRNLFGEEVIIFVHLCIFNVHLVGIRLRTNSLSEPVKVGDQQLLVRDSYIYIYPELPSRGTHRSTGYTPRTLFSQVDHFTCSNRE